MCKQLVGSLLLGLILPIIGYAKTSPLSALQPGPKPAYINQLDDSSDYYEYAGKVGNTSALKFTIQIKADGLPLYFQDTARYPFHADFLSKEIAAYKSMSFDEYVRFIFGDETGEGKELSAGALLYSENFQLKPDLINGTMAFEYYMGKSGQAITVEDVLAQLSSIKLVHQKLNAGIPFLQGRIAIILPQALRFNAKLNTELKASGIPVLWDTPRLRKEFFGMGDVAAYHPALSYGYLKFMSQEEMAKQDYSSKDILVLNEIPLDIGPVSGIISTVPQTPLAHIMLRAVNQNIPDVFILGALEKPEIKSNLGKLVQLQVSADHSYTIKTQAELPDIEALAQTYFKNRVKLLPDPEADLAVSELLFWNQAPVSPDMIKAYGAKGVNFAILDGALEAAGIDRNTYRGGLLLPLSKYQQHIQNRLSNKLCEKAAKECKEDVGQACGEIVPKCSQLSGESKTIEHFLQSMIQDKAAMNDSLLRRKYLAFSRGLIEKADLDTSLSSSLKDAILAHYPANMRIRFRSSTNAEDLPGLNGAGLYESKSGCVQDDIEKLSGSEAQPQSACRTPLEMQRIHERLTKLDPVKDKLVIAELQKDLTQKYPLANAVRKVFASLWTDRAYITRDYYSIDHMKVFMGILMHPSFVDESANGVMVVGEIANGAHEILVSSQTEDISITNPITRGASPEHFTLIRQADGSISSVTYTRRSNLVAGQVLSQAQIESLTKQAVIVHEEQKHRLNKRFTGKTDLEFIVDSQGAVIIKQARPLPQNDPFRPQEE